MTHILAFILGGWFGVLIAALMFATRRNDDDN